MADIDQLSWMVGYWSGKRKGGLVEESWLPPVGGTMLGVARTVRDGETRAEEYMRIGPWEGRICFVTALKLGDPAEILGLRELDEDHVLFGNDDDPKGVRVLYERKVDGLHALITGVREGEPWTLEFDLERVK